MVHFGQVVIGPPGSGKSTYCAAMQQILNAKNRKCIVINLDPQVTLAELPYAPTIDLCSLVDAEKVAAKLNLGPNANAYLMYDLPGQVELFIHHTAMRDVITGLQKANQRVNLIDSTLCADPFKYVAALLSSLSSQIFIELPHINVLSKLGLLRQVKEDLAYRLEYYTEVQDLRELMATLRNGVHLPNHKKFEKFTATLCEIIEDFNLVSFKTMDVEDVGSVEAVMAAVDRAVGYIPLNEGDSSFATNSVFFHEPSLFEDEINGP